jgi:hypothetical protein
MTDTTPPETEAPEYAERDSEAETDLGGGLYRIDIGEPIKAPGRHYGPPHDTPSDH